MGNGLTLSKFIEENREALAEGWLNAAVGTYQEGASKFLKDKEDRIANPMGFVLREMVDTVLGCLASGCDEQALDAAIFPVVQMRAVQDFSPSGAVYFLKLFRDVVSTLAAKQKADDELIHELNEAVFGLLFRAFDHYGTCRDRLADIKLEELKRNLYMLLRKSNMVDVQETD